CGLRLYIRSLTILTTSKKPSTTFGHALRYKNPCRRNYLPAKTSGGGPGRGSQVHHRYTYSAAVRISAPSFVTTIVCSNCALRCLSLVVTVQPSSHRSQAIPPSVSIGSMVKTIPGCITSL